MPRWARWLWARTNDGLNLWAILLLAFGLGTAVVGFLTHVAPVFYFPLVAATILMTAVALRLLTATFDWLVARRKSPLQIIFDPANPNRRFWSLQPNVDENGKQVPGSYWEYRAVVRNTFHNKTIRNVRVVVEAVGPMPTRPELSRFDLNKGTQLDFSPREEQLAVIRTWFGAKLVAGVAYGTDVYGPIKMTASGEDVLPAVKFFHFDPEREPMIWAFGAGELEQLENRSRDPK